MCKPQCALALVALYVGLAQSWDIAVSLGDQLIFYTDGTETNTVHLVSHNLTALVFDEVHNMMLYVDKQSNYDSICGYDLLSMENKCFIKRVGSNIHSIAFDPATRTLFFTDTNEKSINWISFKPGSNNNVNLLIKMNDRIPTDIAVDSCRGYIYWASTIIGFYQNFERARFDVSEREVIDQGLDLLSLTMDPQTRKIYYFDGYIHRFLNSANLDGQNNYIMYLDDYISETKELTVSNDDLYWMDRSEYENESYTTIWHLPKDESYHEQPKEIRKFYNKRPLGIAANYKIKDQVKGLNDCEALSKLISTTTLTNNSLSFQQTTETEQLSEYTTDAKLFCVHGIKVSETTICKCTPGYTGERCDVPVCENYCLQGDCGYNDEGLPKCRCYAGYSGARCEVSVCCGYCLNNGTCSLNKKNEPVCQCKSVYMGDRCELSDCLNYCIQGECSFNQEGLPTCRCNDGYSGERCELYACHGYCLNNGVCSLDEEDEPVCQCVGNHEGIRCEAVKDGTINNIPTYDSANGNLSLADLLSRWRKPSSKMFLTVEV